MNAVLPSRSVGSRSGSSSVFRTAARMEEMRPSAIREILKVTEAPGVISFAGGLPAPDLFPTAAVARAAAKILAEDGPAALQYGTTEGFNPLREWVRAHLAATVGHSVTPDRVLVTHGSQQGLDLVSKVLIDPGGPVLVENPCYLGALQAFRSYQADVIGVRTDAGGLLPDALEETLATAARRPKFLYIIPNFQNPTGVSLSAGRRAEIARIAAAHELPVVEDDPYGLLRFSGESPAALSAEVGMRDWIYLGTASKFLAPGLRVAWLVSSDSRIHERLVTAKQTADLHTSALSQRLVWECVRSPETLAAHVGRLRAVYASRRDAMLDALARYLPEGCSWTRPAGGLFIWVALPALLDATALLRRATEQRVAFVPGEPFWVGAPKRNTLRLNFSNASESRIEEGIARLSRLIGSTPNSPGLMSFKTKLTRSA